MNSDLSNIKKINITNKKILFFGFGGVAKCVLNYLHFYFEYDVKKIYIIEKCKTTLYGPNINDIKHSNIIIDTVSCINFDKLLKQIEIKHDDIIIDLTFSSNTYYFINKCLLLGINYINTSIEDENDNFFGTSINYQQQVVNKLFQDFKNNKNKIRSNILIECGQNPGLIQHYILYALNILNKRINNTTEDDYRPESMINAIKTCKVGTILMSEIDNMFLKKDTFNKSQNNKTKKNRINKQNKIYNTWSVVGLLKEGLDKAEIVEGGILNKFIKPIISDNIIDENKTNLVNSKSVDSNVVFLKECGMNSFMNSISPVLNKNGTHKFVKFNGNLIHHGEIFEMNHLFGKYAPFMSYVYKLNKYAAESVKTYFKNNKFDNDTDITIWLLNNCNSFEVYNNIGKPSKDQIIGHDSIGCTLYCGDKNIDHIYWCGSILDTDNINVMNGFTPTIVQVAAGVLSGLSYIMESKNSNLGLIYSSELDTNYILQKAVPLLGRFFFQEIPINLFDKTLKITTKQIIK
jgi:homospermidine synthase